LFDEPLCKRNNSDNKENTREICCIAQASYTDLSLARALFSNFRTETFLTKRSQQNKKKKVSRRVEWYVDEE
jgi:hypothetical protein